MVTLRGLNFADRRIREILTFRGDLISWTSQFLIFRDFADELPYRGKFSRRKVTKFLPDNEIFPDDKFSPAIIQKLL